MTPAALPADEARRLEVLRELAILDTPPDERLDVMTAYCRSRFDVPIALVSLVDRERQWFASRQGLEARQTSREVSFCAHAVAADSPLVVADAMHDARFADNPLVTGPPGIRFYAGAPIRVRRRALGTVCLIDPRPRQPEADLLPELQVVADAVAAFLERRAAVHVVPAPRQGAADAPGAREESGGDPWRRFVQYCRDHPEAPDAAQLKRIVLDLQSRAVPRLVLEARARRLDSEAAGIVRQMLARVA